MTVTHPPPQVTTIAQATLLAPVSPTGPEGCLCVVNTHLFFHPYAPHIRTMHTAGILEEAAAFLARCADGTQPPAAGECACVRAGERHGRAGREKKRETPGEDCSNGIN